MPNTIDIYSPRTMAGVIRRLPPVGRFFTDTFFKNEKHYDTEKVDFDIVKGGREMASFITHNGGAAVVEKDGYTTVSIKLPLVGNSIVTTAADFLSRRPGESLYGGMTPEERAVEVLAEEFTKLNTMISRREEWMSAKALLEGSIPVLNDSIDFELSNKETVEHLWSASGSDPESDIAKWQDTVFENGFIVCDTLVLGSNAASAFINNAKIQKVLDIKDYRIGEVSPRPVNKHVRYIGHLYKENIDIYTYNEVYSNNGVNTPLMPKNKALLASSEMDSELAYGTVAVLDQKTNNWYSENAARIPDCFAQKDRDVQKLKLSSRPLPMPHEWNSWYVGTVLE